MVGALASLHKSSRCTASELGKKSTMVSSVRNIGLRLLIWVVSTDSMLSLAVLATDRSDEDV